MNILVWIVFGALTGWIASMIARTDAQQGALANIVVGIVGAMLGGFLFNQFGKQSVTGFNFYSLIVAVTGSVILLFILKAIRR
jgi:uncharacterized membrane protein YeaQ/YmgE (transglycosylase-associated protein family)